MLFGKRTVLQLWQRGGAYTWQNIGVESKETGWIKIVLGNRTKGGGGNRVYAIGGGQ